MSPKPWPWSPIAPDRVRRQPVSGANPSSRMQDFMLRPHLSAPLRCLPKLTIVDRAGRVLASPHGSR